MMFFPFKLAFLCSVIFLVDPIFSQKPYGKCTSLQASNDTCELNNSNCSTFIVYRAQQNFNTISSIASLFSLNTSVLLYTNNLTEDDSRNLTLRREIIIPVRCYCLDGFTETTFTYNFSSTDSPIAVACGVFEGLMVNAQSLPLNNSYSKPIDIHIRCACPNPRKNNEVNYFVTYPVMEGDHTDLIARKFNVSEQKIWEANSLGNFGVIYSETTLLVPTNDTPFIKWYISSVPNKSSDPTQVIPLKKVVSAYGRGSQVFLGAGICAVIGLVVICGVLTYIQIKNPPRNFQSLSATSSVSSNVSPDFLDGVSKLKHSLINFRLEEIRIATQNFDEGLKISSRSYHGKIGSSYLTIEQMDSEEVARNVIYILTKINHCNIVKLEGFCNGSDPYLAFEYAENGSLRDCLSKAESDRQLTWARRTQIAFDIAAALHYLHNSTTPAFVHHNINSRNVLLTVDWRAKISGFSLAKPVICSEEKENIKLDREGNLTPDCLINSQVFKVDVFSYGVVLLELLSSKEVVTDGKVMINCVHFLLDEGLVVSSEFLVKLKNFIDPVLEGDYPMADAICLALLAKSCIEEDPDHRPIMDDILISLSRIV